MDTHPPTAYRISVDRDGEPMSLSAAIDEVWSGRTGPERFTLSVRAVATSQPLDVSHGTRSIGMASDNVSCCETPQAKGEVR